MEIPGVDTTMNPAETAGVDPDFDVKPTGHGRAMDTNVPVDNIVIAIDGLEQQDPTEGTELSCKEST
jgi:hypothetical protein